ncbi:MAG: D-alanyl-D-alanine carboxypeptidase [Candidatus Cohnella colombiensis]|uniref:D-alanyl-D-alanine carboxypeptidase n=1 Tax=Candidatus Cohnella colombiensis TaxID=3121368 RepID=A0AA95EY66_9BACL|nr:MAG: D-alanyl-D-alanine carboxypeptidase [Cohnella sp.]
MSNTDLLIRTARSLCLLAIVVCVVCFNYPKNIASASHNLPTPPSNQAKGAALIDVQSGRLIFSQRGDEKMKIASLTKIMTAIVAIEHSSLDDEVKVSVRAAGKEGSSLYLKAGEKMTLRNLIFGLMLRSGNDAAVAIAEHVGGSVEGFAFLMNKKAEEIGLLGSHFMNPHGLDDPQHYSTPNDMARLTAYALHNKDFRNIVSTKVKSAPNPNESWDYKWVNKNKMLHLYEGADGVKTGYTKQALRCLVSSATRDGQQLAVVTLNDGDDWSDHRKLLDYGFNHFQLTEVIGAGEVVPGTAYQAVNTFRYPFASGEQEELRFRVVPRDVTSAAYALGDRGQIEFVLDRKVIGSIALAPALGQTERSDTREHETSSFRHSLHASFNALMFAGG